MTVPAMATTQAANLARVTHPQGVRHFESPTAVPQCRLTLGVTGARRADARQVEAMNRRVRLTAGLGLILAPVTHAYDLAFVSSSMGRGS